MREHLKILGLSLVALVGTVALSASAAQAQWLVLVNEESVVSIALKGETEGGELLVANGIEIRCEGATATATTTLSEEAKKLSGTATATLTGCYELNFSEVCETHSTGQPDETIVASGEPTLYMNASEVFAKATSTEFTNIVFTSPDETCPLTGVNGRVSGSVKIVILEPLVDQETHEIHFLGEGLEFGEEEAEIHMGGEEGPLALILGSVNLVSNNPFAFHLTGL